jgi:hypothetical protein
VTAVMSFEGAGRTSRTVNAAYEQAIALSMFSSRPPPMRSTIALPRFIAVVAHATALGVVRPHSQRILIAGNGLVDVRPAVPGDAIFPGDADVHCRHRPRDGAGSRVRTASDTSAHPRAASELQAASMVGCVVIFPAVAGETPHCFTGRRGEELARRRLQEA